MEEHPIKPAPKPGILCLLIVFFPIAWDSYGSTAITFTSPIQAFAYSPTPVMVPALPTPTTIASSSLPVALKSEGPVILL